MVTKKKLLFIKTKRDSEEQLGKSQHVLITAPSTSTSKSKVSGVHYEGPAEEQEDGTIKCQSEIYEIWGESPNSPKILSSSPSSGNQDERMDLKFENCGEKFKEGISSLFKDDKHKDILEKFWLIFSKTLCLLFYPGRPDSASAIQYYQTKIDELIDEAADLKNRVEFPKLNENIQSCQERLDALNPDGLQFMKNSLKHLSVAVSNKVKIEELEKDLREEIGVLKGLDAEFHHPDYLNFSKDKN